MPEGVVPGPWLLSETLGELRLTFEANKSPLEKRPGTLFCHVVYASLSRSGMKVAFLNNGKEDTLRHQYPSILYPSSPCGDIKDLRNIGTEGKTLWLLCGFASVP